MRNLLLLFMLTPVVCSAQTQIYGFNLPIELDRDTVYKIDLDESYCIQDDSLFGVEENGGCSYLNSYPYLYFYHEFSFNCCTDHFYQIEVAGSDIYISRSDTGTACNCGYCTYQLTYSDQNPEKNEYHIHMACFDSVVFRPTIILERKSNNDFNIRYNSHLGIIYGNYENVSKPNTESRLLIVDLQGKTILTDAFIGNHFEIEATDFIPGFYILKMDHGNHTICEKLMIIK